MRVWGILFFWNTISCVTEVRNHITHNTLFLCPVVCNVCECDIGLFVAYAVGGKMRGSKSQYLFHSVIDWAGEPVYITITVYIDSAYVLGFLICAEGIWDSYRYASRSIALYLFAAARAAVIIWGTSTTTGTAAATASIVECCRNSVIGGYVIKGIACNSTLAYVAYAGKGRANRRTKQRIRPLILLRIEHLISCLAY